MDNTLIELKNCFNINFTYWLSNSYNSNIIKLKDETILNELVSIFKNGLEKIEEECLLEILDVLIQNPDIKWLYYTNQYAVKPLIWGFDVIQPEESINLDTNKVKLLLRDIKIKKVLND